MKRGFMKKKVWFMLGVLVGGMLVYGLQFHMQKVMAERNDFFYSVVSSSLQAENITWKEYPQFRTVDFTLEGELVLTMPKGAQLMPEGLNDASALTEKKRESKKLGYGEQKLSFDEVTYYFDSVEIVANLPNVYEKEKDATYGYELSYADGSQTVVYGYILPMCEEFHVCTKEETRYWEYSQSLELGLLSLSRTYINGDITALMPICPAVKLEKSEDSYVLTITNGGENEWFYSAMVPSVEVWHHGVWMELYTYLSDPCVLTSVAPRESKTIEVLERTDKYYPFFSPGIYRVVVYGRDGTCIMTEEFVLHDDAWN